MEKEQKNTNKVEISRSVYEGLEIIRQSGATNMLDRTTVHQLAQDWELDETALWLETTDSGTYGRLIMYGPEVVEDEPLDHTLDRMDRAYDEQRREFWEGTEVPSETTPEELPMDTMTSPEYNATRNALAQLGKRASLVIADSYETEESGVLLNETHRTVLSQERTRLMQNLAEAARLASELEEVIAAIYQGTDTVLAMIDPEKQ